MAAVVAIPARLKSTRFPRKVLADIGGKPMLWHVYHRVCESKLISGVWVLTDSQEVAEVAKSWGAKTLMTSEECPSGTDRIASVLDQLEGDVIVNVQGDEPLISSAVVDGVVAALESHPADMATPVYRIDSIDDLISPNVVKVVRSSSGAALYFSRSAIPHVRDLDPAHWLSATPFWGHVGVYAYQRNTLTEYSHLAEGSLERVEKLEQLRLLEAGKVIQTVEIDYRPNAVDVPADLERVKRILASDIQAG